MADAWAPKNSNNTIDVASIVNSIKQEQAKKNAPAKKAQADPSTKPKVTDTWDNTASTSDTTSDTDDSEKTGYDAGEITDRERKAAENQSLVSGDNVLAVQNQLARQLANYDYADEQNRALADVQLKQNQRKTSADRYEAQRDLQNAALGLMGSMGNAMNGSSTGNLARMLESRNDKENNTYWAQHQQNQDAIENAYQDSLNQNNVARRDAMQSAEKAIRDIEADWAANLNNINPNLFKQGAVNGIGHLSSTTAWKDNPNGIPAVNRAVLSGYLQPDDATYPYTTNLPRNTLGRYDNRMTVGNRERQRSSSDMTSYFDELMNDINNRASLGRR